MVGRTQPEGGAAVGRARCRADDGAGLFSTAFGLLVFFFFLFFALQLSVTMYTRTLTASTAHEGARRIALRGGPAQPFAVGERPPAGAGSGDPVVDAAVDAAGQMMGRLDSTATFDGLDGDDVVFTVRATPPTFLGSVAGGPWLGSVERTARVRIERPY